MKIYLKRLFTVVFTVLVIAMFSGCTSTTPFSGNSYQDDFSGPVLSGGSVGSSGSR